MPASSTRCPVLVWPMKPDGVKFVEPVQTATGLPPASRMMTLLCGILARVR